MKEILHAKTNTLSNKTRATQGETGLEDRQEYQSATENIEKPTYEARWIWKGC